MITPYSNIISVTTLPIPLLLDTYSGAAAAYSLRKLRNAYTGSAIRVRRASDNTEQDIGFVNNELDTSTLTTFCSGTDGFVKTIYDQSGNSRDATQATAANQPQIVSSGSVITQGGKSSIYGDGSSHFMTYSYTNFPTGDIAFDLFMVENLISSGTATASFSISGTPYITDRRIVTSLCNEGGSNAVRLFGGNTIYSQNEINYRLVNTNYSSGGGAINARVNAQNLTVASFSNTGLSMVADTDLILFGVKSTLENPCETYISEIVLYTSDQSSNRTGIETNINANYQIYWDGSQTSLLDTYSGSAAAYSLRALSSAYTGPLVRVRRASDNAEQDIYAKYDGTLNVSALESFCSGTDGFVKTWYDQSGNGYDATQTTAASQPQIVSSGSVILENGKPAAQFDGGDDALHSSYSGISGEDIPYSNFNVIKNNATSGNPTVLSLNNSTDIQPVTTSILLGNEYGYYFRSGSSSKSSTSAQSHIQTNYNLICEGTTTSVYFNSSQIINSGDTDLNAIVRDTISIGTFRINSPANYFLGNIQEVILYPSDQSSNRTGIETNINNFYSIY